jgi:peptidoglycan-associated lipoprotein
MKLTNFSSLLAFGLVVTLVATSGCNKHPGDVRDIPGARIKIGDLPPAQPLVDTPLPSPGTNGGIAQVDPSQFTNYIRDAEIFKADTAYFNFDSSAVKSSDAPKIAAVADHLKANPSQALEVQGHCDERGTEEYNRSLGERRALALRENLVNLGVKADHIITISYGKDRPAEPGHDEAAWSKNRRGEFILLSPPEKAAP